jgi:hypothetical protein
MVVRDSQELVLVMPGGPSKALISNNDSGMPSDSEELFVVKPGGSVEAPMLGDIRQSVVLRVSEELELVLVLVLPMLNDPRQSVVLRVSEELVLFGPGGPFKALATNEAESSGASTGVPQTFNCRLHMRLWLLANAIPNFLCSDSKSESDTPEPIFK